MWCGRACAGPSNADDVSEWPKARLATIGPGTGTVPELAGEEAWGKDMGEG